MTNADASNQVGKPKNNITKMKTKFILMMVAAALCAACSSSDDLETNDMLPQTNEEQVQSDNVLAFDSQEAYNDALLALSHLESDKEKTAWVEQHLGKITSMHQIYDEAMEEAALLDESEFAIIEFTKKYSSLYFPRHEEDGGFYVPFKNADVSFLANTQAEVMIAGERLSVRDIYSYDDLVRTGRAYYEPEVLATRATTADYEVFNYTGGDINSIGTEYDSGWYKENGKKLKLKLRRKIVSNWTKLHTEVCFRKKTWLGWTNYSSHTTITGTMTLYNCSISSISFSESHSGDSSHDSTFLIPVGCTPLDSNAPYRYELFKMKVNCSVSFRGMPNEKSYEFTFPRALSQEIAASVPKTLKGYGF